MSYGDCLVLPSQILIRATAGRSENPASPMIVMLSETDGDDVRNGARIRIPDLTPNARIQDLTPNPRIQDLTPNP
jgi:hypothetical protein